MRSLKFTPQRNDVRLMKRDNDTTVARQCNLAQLDALASSHITISVAALSSTRLCTSVEVSVLEHVDLIEQMADSDPDTSTHDHD